MPTPAIPRNQQHRTGYVTSNGWSVPDEALRGQSILRPTLISIPPRIPLYAIERIGVGTALVESLASYVMRLAVAHSVSAGDLVFRMLVQIPDLGEQLTAPTKVTAHNTDRLGYEMNGLTNRANNWVRVLESATGCSDLKYLTFLTFQNILYTGFISDRRAWCPSCFEQWRENGDPIYEPLLWSVNAVPCCPIHHRYLSFECPHCKKRKQRSFGYLSRPGHCGQCGGWLGARYQEANYSEAIVSGEEDSVRTCRDVGSLLEAMPRLDQASARIVFRERITEYVDQIGNGRLSRLAKFIGCPAGIVGYWIDGIHVPRLEGLLRAAKLLDVPISSFFIRSDPGSAASNTYPHIQPPENRHQVLSRRHRDELQRRLQESLLGPIALSVSDVARRLGYRSTGPLYKADRELCHKIAVRARSSSRVPLGTRSGIYEPGRMQQVLEQSLRSRHHIPFRQLASELGYAGVVSLPRGKFQDLRGAVRKKIADERNARYANLRVVLQGALTEDPPPTLKDLACRLDYASSVSIKQREPQLCKQIVERQRMAVSNRRKELEQKALDMNSPALTAREIAKCLGMTVGYMDKYFPGTRSIIAERHRLFNLEERETRHKRMREHVHAIAVDLLAQNVYPTEEIIRGNLPEDLRLGWGDVCKVIRDVRLSLGFGRVT